MKKIFSFILFLMISLNVFGLSGVLAGEGDLKLVRTNWFEIIYPPSCEKTATLLYENADRIFEEVTGQYGLVPTFKMPVVITSEVDNVNAFFSSFPFNRIVMYDSSFQNGNELSTTFSENFLSIFRHELTHAVTYNIKNPFWDSVTKVFGDGFLPGAFFVTSGMAEGAAVASESAGGEGRLNNEYAKHYVKQAKIEDKFPRYYDVQGSADSAVSGNQYYFNGAFHQWLQNKYGLEKYADFWHRVININRVGVAWSFKKTYGISIRKAWKEFEESYVVPDIEKNPVEIDLVSDFFDNNKKEYSDRNRGGFRYNSLCSSDTGIIYSDSYSQKVFYVSKNDLQNKKINPDVLFSQIGMESISFSKDGRFVVVSYITNAALNITAKLKIYDTENKCFFDFDEKGAMNGSIISDGNDYYLVYHKYNSPFNNISINRINFSEKNKICKIDEIKSYDLPLNVFCYNFIDISNGYFSYIKKDKLDFSICISDLTGNITKEYPMAEGIFVNDISYSDGNIYFSWAKDGTMPRFGYISLENDSVVLSNEDVSGGIFNPVCVDSNNSKEIIYIGKFYKENRVLTFNEKSLINVNCKIEPYNNLSKDDENKNSILGEQNLAEISSFDINSVSEKFDSLWDLNQGLLLPISIYTSEMFGENSGYDPILLPLGATYVNSNPWSNGTDDLFILTAGWGWLTNSIGVEAIINKGTGSGLFSYEVRLKTELDRNGWKQSAGKLLLSSQFNLGRNSFIFLQNNLNIAGGRHNNINKDGYKGKFESYMPISDKKDFYLSNMFISGYSNVHKTGPGRYENGGFNFDIGVGYIYDKEIGDYFVINSDLSIFVPKLLPIIPKDDFVYNMPLKISLSLLPLNSNYGLTGYSIKHAGYGVLDTNIESVLFSFDVQKAIPFFDILFINDFSISGGYSSTIASYLGSKKGFQLPYVFDYFGNLSNGKSVYLDSVYLKLSMDFCANIGALANSIMKANVYGIVSYPINVLNEKDRGWNFSFGFQGAF